MNEEIKSSAELHDQITPLSSIPEIEEESYND